MVVPIRMRKLTEPEEWALEQIRLRGGSYCPGFELPPTHPLFLTLRALAKKKYVRIEETDDGPRFHAA